MRKLSRKNTQPRSYLALIVVCLIGLTFLLVGGALFGIVAPKQAGEGRRIARLPLLDAREYALATPGTLVAITGVLRDNEPRTLYELVAYRVDEWRVNREDKEESDLDDLNNDPGGWWRTIQVVIPSLTVAVDGGTVRTAAVGGVPLNGAVHEFIEPAYGWGRLARYQGEWLEEGSLRIQGLRNGDLVTVVGNKRTDGSLEPTRLFAGDREALVAHLHDTAQGATIAGVILALIGALLLGGLAFWWGMEKWRSLSQGGLE